MDQELIARKFHTPKKFANADIVPVQIHIVRNNGGDGGVNPVTIYDKLEALNDYLISANLIFEICNPINYIDNSSLLNLPDKEEYPELLTYYIPEAVNIYIVNNISGSLGFFTYGNDNQPFIVIQGETHPTILIHEIGHYFGLIHTHGKFNAQPPDYSDLLPFAYGFPTPVYYEGAVRYFNHSYDDNENGISDCFETGDMICDTPAEPVLFGLIDNQTNCNYIGDAKDYFNDQYVPQIGNIMSYGLSNCLDHFSPQQYIVIRSFYEDNYQHYSSVNCQSGVNPIFQVEAFQESGVEGKSLLGPGIVGISNNPASFDFDAHGAGMNYGSTSSARWKNTIRQINNSIHKISQLRGVYFCWDEAHGGHHDIGFIAEDVGKVLPEIVGYEENGIDAKGMDYGKMSPLLVEALKEIYVEFNKLLDHQRKRISVLELMCFEIRTALMESYSADSSNR